MVSDNALSRGLDMIRLHHDFSASLNFVSMDVMRGKYVRRTRPFLVR